MKFTDFPQPTDLQMKLFRAGLRLDGQLAEALEAYTTALGHLAWHTFGEHLRASCAPDAATDRPVHVCRDDADKALVFMTEALRLAGADQPRGIQ